MSLIDGASHLRSLVHDPVKLLTGTTSTATSKEADLIEPEAQVFSSSSSPPPLVITIDDDPSPPRENEPLAFAGACSTREKIEALRRLICRPASRSGPLESLPSLNCSPHYTSLEKGHRRAK
ncbi:hypothetical protein OSTOST_11497 [Ostertagia ostertagi]